MKIPLCMIVAVILLNSCATAYQKQGATGGWSETQLSPNIFQVRFSGNGFTSREQVSDFALLRSAEIALDHGYKYFVIVDNEAYTQTSRYTTPTRSRTTIDANTFGSVNAYGNVGTFTGNTYGTAHTTTYGGQTYFISKPTITNTILCLDEKPEGTQFVFDAAFIERSLSRKYGLKMSRGWTLSTAAPAVQTRKADPSVTTEQAPYSGESTGDTPIGKIVYLNYDPIALYSEPTEQSKRLAILDKKSALTVIALRSQWIQVKTESGQLGWVRAVWIDK